MWLSMKTGGQYTRYKGAEGEQPEGRDEKDEEYRNRVNKVNKMMEDDRKVIEGAQKANEPIYKQIDVGGLVTLFSKPFILSLFDCQFPSFKLTSAHAPASAVLENRVLI